MSHPKKIHSLFSRGANCKSFAYRNIRVTSELKCVTCKRCIAQITGTSTKKFVYNRQLMRKLDGLKNYMAESYEGWIK